MALSLINDDINSLQNGILMNNIVVVFYKQYHKMLLHRSHGDFPSTVLLYHTRSVVVSHKLLKA